MVPNGNFESASSTADADRRSGRSRGSFMPPGPPNGPHKPGLHPAGYPMPRGPITPYHGGPPQPYAIPACGAVHGPVGAVPHLPPQGSRGFGAGRGNAGAPIGNHLPHQQGSQQAVGSVGSNSNYSTLEGPSSQPSPGGHHCRCLVMFLIRLFNQTNLFGMGSLLVACLRISWEMISKARVHWKSFRTWSERQDDNRCVRVLPGVPQILF